MRTLQSVVSQLRPEDELILDINDSCAWGHSARNRMMPRAKGTHLLFIDDDDYYFPDALTAVREGIVEAPEKVHLFRMQLDDGRIIPHTSGFLACGNVSTQTVCVPNVWKGQGGLGNALGLPQWGDRYEGDWDFISACCTLLGPPVWNSSIIAFYSTASSPLRLKEN